MVFYDGAALESQVGLEVLGDLADEALLWNRKSVLKSWAIWRTRRCSGSQVGLEVLGDLAYEALEWQLLDEELGRLLVSSDLTESDGSWAIS